MNLVMWGWLPYLLVNSVVADSFAGERERHTLETLLASRLSDQAILIGKIAASLLYGWGITLIAVLIGLITVNLAHGHGRLLLFPAPILAGILGVTLLIAALSAGLGVVVSLRASTVRQAQQTLSYGFFLFFIPVLIFPMLPGEVQARIVGSLSVSNPVALVIAICAGLLIIDLALFGLAAARFRRARLILD
jgi:ABC-2 type transport system permease protein